MIQDQTTQTLLQDIAAIKANLTSVNKRIDKNENRTDHIHKLAANLENLTEQLKIQNKRLEKMFDSFDARMKLQSERIDEVEKKESVLEKKLLEKDSKRWESVVGAIIIAMATAVVMLLFGNINLY